MFSRSHQRPLGLILVGLTLIMLVATAPALGKPTHAKATADQAGQYRLVTTKQGEALALAKAKAAARGIASVALPKHKTIAFIHFDAQSASSQRLYAAIKNAAAYLGYHVIVCDPAGDPQKAQQCGTAMLAQHADLIISYQHEPAEFGSVLKDAKSRGAVWVNVAEGVTPGPYMSQYVANDPHVQHILDQWFISRLKARAKKYGNSGAPQILVQGAPSAGLSALQEGNQIKADMKRGGVDIVVNHDLDLSNLVQDTLNNTKQSLQQYPKLAGVWTICDFCVPLLAQAVGKRQGADRPIVTGNYSTPQTVAGIRSGTIDGVVDVPWEAFAWTAIDRALDHWSRSAPMGGPATVFKYGLPFGRPYILDRSNVRASGKIPIFSPDYVRFFETKWSKEYKR
jgi:ABC-type sugar transport system substrate-binding protein